MRMIFRELMTRHKGDWTKVMEHVRVVRFTLSEKDRIGIGTFQPKDEKNQDSTELTGDINYRKIAEFGSDSDPRAFNFDGEFQVANRGVIEFVEVLKLDVAFLYDLLGASQEHVVKPKKFAQTYIDEVIIGHTNEPEFRKLQNNEFMEALRDRTVKIDIPYITKLNEEIRIYEKDFGRGKVQGVFVAPHTVEMAAMWAILTRLEPPKKSDLSLMQKLKLYNGKTLSGYTEDNVKELRKEAVREGLDGISPPLYPDKISNTLVKYGHLGCVNPFMLFNEMDSGLRHHTLISSEEKRREYKELLAAVKQEYEDIIKNEVQRAISADEGAISNLCANYIDNIKAHTQREKVRNRYTGQLEQPDERLMRSIEEKIDIPESRKDDFRPRDHELYRRAGGRGQALRLQDQRAPPPRARAQAVRGPEGLDQALEPREQRGGQKHAGEDRRGEDAAHPRLRLRRDLGHRHPQLRGFDLRARRRERTRLTRKEGRCRDVESG